MKSKLQTLWIDHKGGLTANKKKGYSMPLYSATDVDVEMKKSTEAAGAAMKKPLMDEIVIRFKPYFREPMLSGVKTCTSRTKTMGKPGDWFTAFGAQFELLSVEEVRLHEVASMWKEEGCTSADHFKEVWREIHPVVGYDDYQLVKLHRFRRAQP